MQYNNRPSLVWSGVVTKYTQFSHRYFVNDPRIRQTDTALCTDHVRLSLAGKTQDAPKRGTISVT